MFYIAQYQVRWTAENRPFVGQHFVVKEITSDVTTCETTCIMGLPLEDYVYTLRGHTHVALPKRPGNDCDVDCYILTTIVGGDIVTMHSFVYT